MITIIFSESNIAQDCIPVYVHGLGGDGTQWAGWRTLFNTERRIDQGTPLDGARISNNLPNGQVSSFIVNGVDKILKGPIRQFGPTSGALYQVASRFFKNIADKHVQDIITKLMGGATQTDLAENSPYMNNGHRAASSAMPKVHIYGNENSPVLWRLASIAANWADGELVSLTNQAYDVGNAARITHINLAFANPIMAPQYTYVADSWSTSGNWIKTGSENGWNDLIGSSTAATITTTTQVINWSGVNQCLSQYTQATYEQYMQCQLQNTQTVNYTYYSPVNGLSDGFIKAPSAAGYNSNWSGNARKIEALGVNHLEMKNHAVMKDAYNEFSMGCQARIHFLIL